MSYLYFINSSTHCKKTKFVVLKVKASSKDNKLKKNCKKLIVYFTIIPPLTLYNPSYAIVYTCQHIFIYTLLIYIHLMLYYKTIL